MRGAFTLIELVVVLAILAALALIFMRSVDVKQYVAISNLEDDFAMFKLRLDDEMRFALSATVTSSQPDATTLTVSFRVEGGTGGERDIDIELRNESGPVCNTTKNILELSGRTGTHKFRRLCFENVTTDGTSGVIFVVKEPLAERKLYYPLIGR